MNIDLTGSTGNGAGAGQDLIKDSSEATFVADVIEASNQVPVIVDFWAPWCGPCKQLGPMLEKIVSQAQGAVKLVKINIDDNQQIAQQLRIQSIPAVIAFQNGQPVDGFMGVQPESQVKAFVERLGGEVGPLPVEQLIERGKQALEAGDVQTAGAAFSQVMQAEPENEAAIAGLARCLLAGGQVDEAREVLAQAPEDTKDNDIISARAALELAAVAEDAGDVGELRAAVTANPKDHQARFDLAQALNANGDRQGAVDELIAIVAANREWNDQAARKELLKYFEAYGPTDEITVSGRRQLSSILFS